MCNLSLFGSIIFVSLPSSIMLEKIFLIQQCTVKTCIKRLPLKQRKKWPYKAGDLLKEV